jgi:diaminohydroxyphosphoribosylaminopyrimidine deaminase/5-amino-6-(5-phosphoribosylamino)uracil reductase
LVEAGSHLAAALLQAHMVDRIVWFSAPIIIGGDGAPAAQGFGVEQLRDAPRWSSRAIKRAGADVVEILVKE